MQKRFHHVEHEREHFGSWLRHIDN
jgi:hypothetical protein